MRKLFFFLGGGLLFFCSIGNSQVLPPGFSTTTIGSNWVIPLGTAFTKDGQKVFVWEKDGRVYVCNRDASGNYIKQTTPVLDISEEVANWGDHGLMGFALDPNYLSNGLIYLLYVVDRHYLMNFGTPAYNPATSSTGATIGRITRYKTIASGSDLATDLSSRMILLGESKSTGIALTHDSHGLGTLAFAADGTLLATCGDGGSYYAVDKGSDPDTDFDLALIDGIIRPEENVGAFRAQILNCHNGKLLRIDPVTGNGVSSNPYYSADQPRSPKSRVWAFGLRNPFRFSVKPGTGSTNPAAADVGEIYIGDVGWNTYEEVNVITTPGVNCGWPLFEGLTPTPGYTQALTANADEPNPLFGINGCNQQFFNFQDLLKQATADNDKTIYNPCNPLVSIGTGNRFFHQRPIIDWQHFADTSRVGIFSGNNAATAQIGTPESNVIGAPFQGNCALGGPWYSGNSFPTEYSNRYFVADHDANWIKCISTEYTDHVTEVKDFGSGFSGIVNLNMNPLDGSLVVVELGNFSTIPTTIKQIKYGGNESPIVKLTSDKIYGPSTLNVNFNGSNSSDPDGSIAGYTWSFGDGNTSDLANPSHDFTAPANTPAKFVVRLTVTDNLGASSTDSIIISVNNTPPVVNITSPVKNSLYKVGPDTLYTCTATVTDAEHTPGELKYQWQAFLRHNSHAHLEHESTETTTSTNIARLGCDGATFYWLIKLTVTDAAGLSTADSSKIFPDCNLAADVTPPTVASVLPVNGATAVITNTTVTANLSEIIDPATVNTNTFQLKDAGNNSVPATINASSNQITLTPSAALANSAVYTATIKGGASGIKDLAGNALAGDYTWTFTTGAGSGVTSSTIFLPTSEPQEALNNDGQAIEVGMKFRSIQNGVVTGIRYYKGLNATGTRTGHLWSSTGTLLGTATFTGETASGWQQVLFTAPIAITANTTYVVSYFSSTGYYASSVNYFTQAVVNGPLRALANGEDGPNGIYQYSTTSVFPSNNGNASNYWVDVVFSTGGGSNVSPTVTTHPASQTKCAGTNASFTSAANGNPLPTVQWQVSTNGTSWTNISGATNSALTFATTIADNNKQFRAVWTNTGSSVNSALATLTVNSIPSAPLVSVADNCGNSVLTASGFTGSLLWGNSETTSSITVLTGGTYTVTQTINGCTSAAGAGTAAPKVIPQLSGNLSATATSGTAFTYNAASTTVGTTFAWSRATVTGISNAAASGTGSVTETLNNTTTSPVNVVYAYTLTANGCSNAQNVVVTVNPVPTGACTISNTSLSSTFNATAIAAGRYIWFNSSFDPGPLPAGTDPVTITVTNGVISFTANNVQYTLSVPNARIRFDATVTSASTQFVNNVWETVVPRSYTNDIFLSGLSYPVPVNFPGNYMNVKWTADISIDKTGISLGWRWGAAVYTSFAVHSGINVKPINGSTQNPYANTDRASTPENFKSFVVDGAKGTGGTNYTGSFSTVNTATCTGNPISVPPPTVTVVNNCGNSVLTAGSFTGSLLWSNGATTSSITVTTPGDYSVAQTVNGYTSAAASGTAAPKSIPVLSGNLTATATSGTAFTYTASSTTAGTTFAWSRAIVTGISNAAANGTGNINETLVNTTSSPVNVTYVYTLMVNDCSSTQNVVVTVNPAAPTTTGNCTIDNSSVLSHFNATAIPSGRYIWFNSTLDPGPLGTGTDPVTINITNSVISFTANNVPYTLSVPDARIRFDATVTTASTQFVNNVWETVLPRSYTNDIFMNGLSYPVPVNFPGNYMNVKWTSDIDIDKAGISVGWRWGAAVYSNFSGHAGINVKPINGSTQNPYANSDRAGTPENFKSFVVGGATGAGGTNYTGSFSAINTATCTVIVAQRSPVQTTTKQPPLEKQMPVLSGSELSKERLAIYVMPNPSNTYFNLAIRSNNENPVRVIVTNIFGQIMEKHEKIASNTVLKLGHKLSSGTYFIEIIQNNQRRIMKIIKVN